MVKLSFKQKKFLSSLIKLKEAKKQKIIALLDKSISLEHDSRAVKKNSCFMCLPGQREHGFNFIETIIKKTSLILVDKKHQSQIIPQKKIFFIPQLEKIFTNFTLGFYNWPSKKLKIVGVTGTNGKTSISYILGKLYRKAGCQTSTIGTLGVNINNKFYPTLNTTPHLVEIQKLLYNQAKKNVQVIIMEISSHALMLGRAQGIEFDNIIWTNLTPEHLDFHKGMKSYFKAKAKIFDLLEASSKNNKKAFINYDSLKNYPIKKQLLKYKTFKTYFLKKLNKPNQELEEADFTYTIKKNEMELGYRLNKNAKKKNYQTNLMGNFNGENIAFSLMEMVKSKTILLLDKRLSKSSKSSPTLRLPFINIPGRLEKINFKRTWLEALHPIKKKPEIFIDYAHTPDALKNLLDTFKKLGYKIICIFGCGGNRDKEKRMLMGRVASQKSDLVILTSDNPRRENPLSIINQIEKGMVELKLFNKKNQKKNLRVYYKEVDRKKAIQLGLEILLKKLKKLEKTVLLIAGKGHESYQIIGDKVFSFSDREVVKSFFQRKEYSGY